VLKRHAPENASHPIGVYRRLRKCLGIANAEYKQIGKGKRKSYRCSSATSIDGSVVGC